MEPVRPLVDKYAFELLGTRPFAARDFHETRAGVCRLTAPLTHELAETLGRWRQLVGRVAEDFAAALESGRVPTPISGRRRAEARPGGPKAKAEVTSIKAGRCPWCGSPTERGRRTCSPECGARIKGANVAPMTQAASERMKRLAREPEHPALSPEANDKRRRTRREQRAAELAWEAEHPEPADTNLFEREVLPRLQGRSVSDISRATGLSVAYCARIRRGELTPHPRWWATLKDVDSLLGKRPVEE